MMPQYNATCNADKNVSLFDLTYTQNEEGAIFVLFAVSDVAKKKKIGKNHRQKIAAFSSQVFGQASQWISGYSLLNLVANLVDLEVSVINMPS